MPVANFYDEVQRSNNKHAAGLEIIEGELMEEGLADVVTCGLESFYQYMRKVYRDWDAFMAYVDARTGEYTDQWWQSLGKEIAQ